MLSSGTRKHSQKEGLEKVSRYEIGTLKPCENVHDDERKCLEWMKSGECAKNKNFMLAKCRKACQKCDEIYVRESSERDDYVNVFFDVEVTLKAHFRRSRMETTTEGRRRI